MSDARPKPQPPKKPLSVKPTLDMLAQRINRAPEPGSPYSDEALFAKLRTQNKPQ